MAETADRATLLKQIIEWLVATRALATIDERQGVLALAGFNDQQMGEIELEGSPNIFSLRLLNLLLDYNPLSEGKKLITSLLETVGAALGLDQQTTMTELVAKVNAYSPLPDPARGVGPARVPIQLSGSQMGQFYEALKHAFRSINDLRRMVLFELGKRLDEFADISNLNNAVFDLIQTAEAEGWVEELVYAARDSNPGNGQLRALAEQLGLAGPPS